MAQPNSAPANGCGKSLSKPLRWVIRDICTIATVVVLGFYHVFSK